ncbi:hypothetical protein IGI04_018492 [Brassica rapa subsp. trilocularis]|uniref:Smr domain-containing protein n=1 Tax=Brassica rapa subsp. trilocularis TaxID=1813537 RepID=A0ABQ7MD60_BRACM|nr:hypothetical protein IGI04_018492 [Brassica rapa subsp. trilocularis]
MASTPPHWSLFTATTSNHRQTRQQPNHRQWLPPRVSSSPRGSRSLSAAPPSSPSPVSHRKLPTFSPLVTPNSSPPLSSDFSGRRSTRFVSKMHFNRPKTTTSTRHSPAAANALHSLTAFSGDDGETTFQSLISTFEPTLHSSDDYTFLLRELGNRGECDKALLLYHFAVQRERRKNERGKLASAMIGTLGRLGKVSIAKTVFESALSGGYGNTVYAFSALISAYGRSGLHNEAITVFDSMKSYGLRPNLVTYNAVIDACGKGGMEFSKVAEFFEEMERNGVQPDRITFNSLLGVCSRGGLWEVARSLFHEMANRKIEQDVFSYNTLLDAVCKGGQMDLSFDVLAQMRANRITPNVVSYSTVIDGFAKAGRFDEALTLFDEMRCLGIALDRVSYNTLLSIYTKVGRDEEALDVLREMASVGIKKDVVTYNALLGGYGKRGKYVEVESVFDEMKREGVLPNLLTYSTLIDVYSKGGLYREAMEVFREFKSVGLRGDVVLYSALIDALCKSGLVGSAVSLIDEMSKEGISPNVVTYNSIIDAFGRSAAMECRGGSLSTLNGTDDHRVIEIFEQLTSESSNRKKKECEEGVNELFSILEVIRKMHQLDIKPNVVTFSAILNACSWCNSFEDASMLLGELKLFDNQVYGVVHGLLMGRRENVWLQARSLFDKVKEMDGSTASAFYNALTDLLWHFGQKRGAQIVALEGRSRQVWENVWSTSCLDLHLMSSGAARAMVHAWLLNIRSIVYEGHELPKVMSILTGWGKHSKVVGDGALRPAVEALFRGMDAPFHLSKCNMGRFTSSGSVVATWLRESATLKLLTLHDHLTTEANTTMRSSDQQGQASLTLQPLLLSRFQMASNGDKPLIVSFGEMLIDFVPTESGVSLAEAPGFLKAPGGAPANVAIAVSRLGGRSAFVGKLGDDEFGHMLAGILRKNGVADQGINFDTGARTALAFVTLKADGDREFMFYRNPSADMLLRPDELNLELIRSAKVFHYGSISLIVEPCRSAHLKAMEVAKEAGALLSYDPNLREPLWPSKEEAKTQIMSIWDKAEIIKVSDVELEFLTGSNKIDDETAMSLWHPNLKLLLVTLGEKGCRYYATNFRGSVDPFHVNAVDTTGAGDSFVGALLNKIADDHSILEDEERLRKVLRFANACGAITTTKKGAIPALPSDAEVLSFLEGK